MNHPLHHKTTAAKSRRDGQANGGFALVIALSLMAFVLLLLLSITTLTQVEIKTASLQKDKLEAQQNALLGLSTAIGQLQKLAGPDTRITAPAESIATVNGPRQVTGVWRSWEGRDHHTSGAQIGQAFAPNYASKLQSGELDPDSNQAGRFLGWLSSDALSNQDPTDPPTLAEVAGTDGTIALLSANTLGSGRTSEEVHVTPTAIDNGSSGNYAWWISGENSKAQLKHEDAPTTTVDWAARGATFGTTDSEVFNFQSDTKLNRINSREAFDLLPTVSSPPSGVSASGQYAHDLTAWSRGLLTNAATGGWKRDLSLMSEDWDQLPATNLPFFTLEPGVETSASKANGSISAPQLLIYPWGTTQAKSAGGRNTNPSPVVSWSALQDYCTQYRDISSSTSGGTVSLPSFAPPFRNSADLNDYRDTIRRHPVVARLHWVFSYASILNTDPAATAEEAYIACLDVNPAITLWNPYNVALTIDPLTIKLWQPCPASFTFTMGSTTYPRISMNEIVGNKILELKLSGSGSNNPISLQPGEARLFSAQVNSPVAGSSKVDLYPGYRTNGGFRYDKLDYSKGSKAVAIKGSANDRLSATVNRDASVTGADGVSKIGLRLMVEDSQQENIAFHYAISWPQGDFSLINPAPGDGPSDNLELQWLTSSPQSFLASYCSLNAATIGPEGDLAGKGYLRSNPLRFYSESNLALGCPYKWEYFALNGANGGDGLPEATPGNHSFIGTTFRADQGLTHVIAAELPLRPLQSLAQLQHFDLTNTNQTSPYAYNVIGNSHAYGMFTPETVYDSSAHASHLPYRFDHSYLANHLLFDDWFISSIAPETGAWSNNTTRSKEEVYQDHLSQSEPLPNTAYRPRTPASSATEAASRANADLSPNTAWRDIASELEVEGMFNINSTSVPAWTAILRNSRDARMAQLAYTSGNWEVQLDNASNTGTPFSRTSVAGSSSTDIGNNPELGTNARLSNAQIDALATEIVNQIKLRGPFLSLSEFVNRQLTNDKDLAMAGTIEAALLELSATGGSDNPNAQIQQLFPTQTDWPNRPGQLFPEADEGYIAYGFPGWVRQADILRSLAPILSVRDDTFVIRSYGETSASISGKETSRAWCEAVVQRKADYVDPADASTVLPSSDTLSSTANARFGRRFEIISFRWLAPEEI